MQMAGTSVDLMVAVMVEKMVPPTVMKLGVQ
jgi:hypothetical protein